MFLIKILGGTLVQEEPEAASPTATLRRVRDPPGGYSGGIGVAEGSGEA